MYLLQRVVGVDDLIRAIKRGKPNKYTHGTQSTVYSIYLVPTALKKTPPELSCSKHRRGVEEATR